MTNVAFESPLRLGYQFARVTGVARRFEEASGGVGESDVTSAAFDDHTILPTV